MSSQAAQFDVVVVGGGPAGIMAALAASGAGAKVLLLEKAERLGKKILISGGGKCNIANSNVDLTNFHGSHPRFVSDVLHNFTNDDLVAWINSLGIATVVDERNGKIWPEIMLSKVVLRALMLALGEAGVTVCVNAGLKSAKKREDGIFELEAGRDIEITAKKLILSTGGRAFPQLGADGSGLGIAESFGHSLVPQYPALVGLEAAEPWMTEIMGLTLDDVGLSLVSDGKEIVAARGSLLFTPYGVNSPAIFRISREVEPLLEAGKECTLRINFNPDEAPDWESAGQLIEETFGAHTKKHCGIVAGYVFGARRVGDAMIKEIGMETTRRVRELQKKHMDALRELLFRAPVRILKTQGYNRAEVMRGGVDVRKIKPRTMESKLVEGLYICGEMLDVDADVGGYNFQFAFGSGKLAGEAAASGNA